MKKLITFIFVLVGSNANAFDRLYCQSRLDDWIVTLTDSTKSAVLTPFNQSMSLSENQSHTLYVMNAAGEKVITVFPWNTLYVRIPSQTKITHEVRIKETSSGFLIEIMDRKSKLNRSLNCRFTF